MLFRSRYALQDASDELQRDYEREMAAQGIGFYPYPVVVGYVLIPVQHNTDY